MKKKLIEIKNELWIPFEWKDKELGRAEFIICIKFKRGKISEFWVDPTQTRLTECWHFSSNDYYIHDFGISSYENLEESRVWLVHWCNDHKTFAFRVYSPPHAKYLCINNYGISFYISNFG